MGRNRLRDGKGFAEGTDKALLTEVLKMSVASCLAWVIYLPLHEYGHYWAASALGIDTYIDGDRVIPVTAGPIPEAASTLFRLAGGIVAGSVLLSLFFLLKKPYAYGVLPLAAGEFAYSPFDGTPFGYAIGLAAMAGAWALLVGPRLIRFVRVEGAWDHRRRDLFPSRGGRGHALPPGANAWGAAERAWDWKANRRA